MEEWGRKIGFGETVESRNYHPPTARNSVKEVHPWENTTEKHSNLGFSQKGKNNLEGIKLGSEHQGSFNHNVICECHNHCINVSNGSLFILGVFILGLYIKLHTTHLAAQQYLVEMAEVAWTEVAQISTKAEMAKAEAAETRKEAAGARAREEAVRAEAVEEARRLRHGTEEAEGRADKTKAKATEDVRKLMRVLAEAGARVEASKVAFFHAAEAREAAEARAVAAEARAELLRASCRAGGI